MWALAEDVNLGKGDNGREGRDELVYFARLMVEWIFVSGFDDRENVQFYKRELN